MTRRAGLVPITVAFALIAITACGSTSEPRMGFGHDSRIYHASHDETLNADALLAARLKMALDSDPLTRSTTIHVAVKQGRARLSGFVPNAAAKLRATDLVQQVEGVAAVENRLILRYHADARNDPFGDARVYL